MFDPGYAQAGNVYAQTTGVMTRPNLLPPAEVLLGPAEEGYVVGSKRLRTEGGEYNYATWVSLDSVAEWAPPTAVSLPYGTPTSRVWLPVVLPGHLSNVLRISPTTGLPEIGKVVYGGIDAANVAASRVLAMNSLGNGMEWVPNTTLPTNPSASRMVLMSQNSNPPAYALADPYVLTPLPVPYFHVTTLPLSTWFTVATISWNPALYNTTDMRLRVSFVIDSSGLFHRKLQVAVSSTLNDAFGYSGVVVGGITGIPGYDYWVKEGADGTVGQSSGLLESTFGPTTGILGPVSATLYVNVRIDTIPGATIPGPSWPQIVGTWGIQSTRILP